MARKYSAALKISNAITVDFVGPIDNRQVVETYDDLKATATWLSGGGYRVYPGMMVTLVTGEAYVYIGAVASTEFTQDAKWVKIGTGGGGGGTDVSAFHYKGSKATLSELGTEVASNGANQGDVYNIEDDFTLGDKSYAGGTNVVFIADVAAGSATWQNSVDPLTGDFITKSYLQTNYYTKSSVDGLLPSSDEKLNATQRAKLDLINSDCVGSNKFSTDLLTLKHGVAVADGAKLWSLLALFEANGQLNFLTAGGYKVKIEVHNAGTSVSTFSFMVKGEHYKGTFQKSGDTYTMSWAYYDSTTLLPVGVNYTDLYTTQAAFTAVAQQNKTLVENALTQIAGYNNRITAVENKLKWYDLDS